MQTNVRQKFDQQPSMVRRHHIQPLTTWPRNCRQRKIVGSIVCISIAWTFEMMLNNNDKHNLPYVNFNLNSSFWFLKYILISEILHISWRIVMRTMAHQNAWIMDGKLLGVLSSVQHKPISCALITMMN